MVNLPAMLKPADTTQKMTFSIKDLFSKYDQIRRKPRVWSHLLKKSLMENFIFFAVRLSCIAMGWWVIYEYLEYSRK